MPDRDIWTKIIGATAIMLTGLTASLRGIFVTQTKFGLAQAKCQANITKELTAIKNEQKVHRQYLSSIAIKLHIKDEDIPKL